MNWLKNTKHKSLSKFEADGSLSEDQKNVLRGVHKRHLSYADSPSHKDLDFLQEIYGVSIHKIIASMQYIHFVIFRRSVTLSDHKQ